MADEFDDLPDDQSGRIDAFFERHAIPSNLYSQSVDQAITFAAAAAEDGVATPVAHWQPYGGRNIGGRVRALAQHPDNPLVIYAGTGGGGVFKSSDGGDTWAPVGGPRGIFAVGALAIARSDPNVLYIGTGEPVVQHTVNSGGTVVVSNNYPGGRGLFRLQEGTPLGAAEVGPLATAGAGTNGAADSVARIAVDPRDADRCWVATHTGLWRRERSAAGVSFRREPVPPGMPALGVLGSAATDVVAHDGFDPAHPERVRLFVAIGGVGIFRGVFDRSDPALNVAWDPMLTDQLPLPCAPAAMTWDRIRLGVCASQPDHVYAVAEAAAAGGGGAPLGAWYSADAGQHWAARTLPPDTLGSVLWYSLYVEVHPDNPAIAVIGALNIVRSTDFGQTWATVLDWLNFDAGDHAQHADQHAALFDAGDPRRLWIGNDGGISMADDVVQGQPLVDRGWRKRSHGIAAAMFNDVAVHPTYPCMIGGGLQDNGTYVSFGGETWYSVFGGDGGQMSFEVADPRQFIAPFQGNPPAAGQPPQNGLIRSAVSAVPAVFGFGARAPTNADKDPPNDVFATAAAVVESGILYPAHPSLFVSVVQHHPATIGHMMVGRQLGGAYHSVNFGTAYTQLVFTPAVNIGNASVTALAFGSQVGVAADLWIGSARGVLLLGTGATLAKAWTNVALPAPANSQVTRIAVHPADDRYVAVCTASSAAGQQGRVFLSADRGAHWTDISALTAAGAPQPGSVPVGPCTSLAFDPQPANTALQTLFVGTLGGVFVIRNLPRRSPGAGAALPAFAPAWSRFSGVPSGQSDGPAAMPLILVEDMAVVTLAAITDPGVVANAPETKSRARLYAATFGRGMYACDITRTLPAGVPAGGPPVRLYLRQTVIEDGLSYPRPTPDTLNKPRAASKPFQLAGDPRFLAGSMPFNDREAFDIRVDNAPFQFFEDVLDGVEFDESLHTRAVAAGETNAIYVQVHSCGWQAVPAPGATVHLYFAPSPAPGPDPAADPVPDLHVGFWTHWTDAVLPAPGAVPVAPAATWQRAGTVVTLKSVGPNQPAVARFDWVPPATLGTHVALLAVVTAAADPLLPAAQPLVMKTLLRNQRRVALRIAPIPSFVPDLYVRDGLDDIGRLGGVAFGGRSPDILVFQAEIPAPLRAGVASLTTDARSGDRVAAGDNFVYVRVLNRKALDTAVDVELFWAQATPPTSAAADPAGPLSDNTKWQAVPAVGAVTNVVVPASGAVLAAFKFSTRPAPVADIANALAFIALIKAHDPGDAEPLKARVTDPASVWRFFLQSADANNAALRTVLYAA